MFAKKFAALRILLLMLFVVIFAGCEGGSSNFLGSLFGQSGVIVARSGDIPGSSGPGKQTNAVPEPSTMALLGCGMAAAFFMKMKDDKRL